jgi:hypothetical protein
MKAKVVASEAELCVLMEEYLRDLHWDVYKEVTVGTGIIDIVAKQGPVLWGIEAKMTAGLGLLEQAMSRLRYCHRVSVVVPTGVTYMFEQLCLRDGIGIFRADEQTQYGTSLADRKQVKCVRELLPATLRRKVIGVKLMDGMRDTEAGHPSPLRVTGFTETCNSIRRVLSKHPDGMWLKELVGEIQHHYRTPSTARASLQHWMRAGVIKGVRYEGGRAFLASAADLAQRAEGGGA